MGIGETAMRKLMEGRAPGRPGVAGKVGDLLRVISGGEWCEQQTSLMRGLAFGILDPDGERYRLARLHQRECPACRAYVLSLRGLAAVLPPLALPWSLEPVPEPERVRVRVRVLVPEPVLGRWRGWSRIWCGRGVWRRRCRRDGGRCRRGGRGRERRRWSRGRHRGRPGRRQARGRLRARTERWLRGGRRSAARGGEGEPPATVARCCREHCCLARRACEHGTGRLGG